MRIPIAHALAWPRRHRDRLARGSTSRRSARLDFFAPDPVRFPALRLARDALRAGGGAPTILQPPTRWRSTPSSPGGSASSTSRDSWRRCWTGWAAPPADDAGGRCSTLDARCAPGTRQLDRRRLSAPLDAFGNDAMLPDTCRRRLPQLRSPSWSCSACSCSCTSSATTSPRAGAACTSRRSRSASAAPFASWTDRVGTVWKLAWLPLGGYVKLHGQERPEDVAPEVRAALDSRAGPSTRSRSARARSSSRPGRSPISCSPRCCSRCCSRPSGRPVSAAGGRRGACPTAPPPTAGLHAGRPRSPRSTAQPVTPLRGHPAHRRRRSPGQHADHADRSAAAPTETLPVTARRADDGRTASRACSASAAASTEYRPPRPARRGRAPASTQTWDVTAQTLAGLGQMLSGARGTDELGGPLRHRPAVGAGRRSSASPAWSASSPCCRSISA